LDRARENALAAFSRAGRNYSRLSVMFRASIAAASGLNVTDAECLDFLADEGRATAGQLAELTGLTTGAITSVIRRLTASGYVDVERDPADRRRVIISPRLENLSAAGARYEAFGARGAELLAGYTVEDLAFLTAHYERMSELYQHEIERSKSADLSQGESKHF
jgi:DNA-binding MarR family transcriptional regulator